MYYIGVTARELCHYFFSPDVRMEWETTVDQATVIEKVSNDTLVFRQVHKTIWPATARDGVFWSHQRKISAGTNDSAPGSRDTWIVCNRSIDHPSFPINQNGCIRLDMTIIMVGDTVVSDDAKDKDVGCITRDEVTCKVTYCSVINPGGWLPAPALRTVYKREFPRFLKNFSTYITNKTASKPIMW
jgi:collagen type IV alpha-3-binding protein